MPTPRTMARYAAILAKTTWTERDILTIKAAVRSGRLEPSAVPRYPHNIVIHITSEQTDKGLAWLRKNRNRATLCHWPVGWARALDMFQRFIFRGFVVRRTMYGGLTAWPVWQVVHDGGTFDYYCSECAREWVHMASPKRPCTQGMLDLR